MQPRISARNAKVSEETKAHIVKACDKLLQFHDGIVDCEVMIDRTRAGTGVEMVVKVPHHRLTSSSCDENLYKALSEAQDRMEAQLRKQHEKALARR